MCTATVLAFYLAGSRKTLQRLAGEKDVIAGLSQVNAVLLLMDQQGSCSEVFLPDEITAGKAMFSLIHKLQILWKYRFTPITQVFIKLISF